MRSDKPLTLEQRRFAEENHNLIYGFLSLYGFDFENWYDVAALGFCRAVSKYKASQKCPFPSFAYQTMRNSVRDEIRREARRTNGAVTVSLYDEIGDGLTYADVLGVEDETACINLRDCIQAFMRTLTPQQQFIFTAMLDGKTQSAISAQIGLSQGYVGRLVKELKNKFTAVINGD